MSRYALTVFLAVSFAVIAPAADLDLTKAVVVASATLTRHEKRAVKLLTEEVAKRSWVRWEVVETAPASGPAIVIEGYLPIKKVGGGPGNPKWIEESYRIATNLDRAHVHVKGTDARGTLFGIGRLLREMRIERERVTLPADFIVTSAPQKRIRGHQLGYRPKTNSYDGWTVAMWDQYIRDLIVFGCNAIELIPPRSDDDADSPMFPEPPLRMLAAVSKIADDFGIDVWLWYPAMDADYTKPETVEFALKEWAAVFKACPRIDAVFVPGGDPGHTPPKVLFPFLEKQTANLKAIHPMAQMWMSPQSFTAPAYADFVELMKAEPKWLSGIVHGPQVRVPLSELRKHVPAKYPIRDYPDITHSRTCQYPVPDWDLAFALTIGREGVNPRPTQMKAIFDYAKPHTDGFITYSEGCHDDVNKIVWSALGWDDKADVKEVMRQYGRYFIGPKLGDRFAEGLMALERNWVGPIQTNRVIGITLTQFRAMEADAGPVEKLNWRFQQGLYRAYYDAYVKARVLHEIGTSFSARTTLAAGHVDEALATLDRAKATGPAPELRARIDQLAEALFQTTRAQLSVKKYHAIGPFRGASLDTLDTPLSDEKWLRAEIEAIRKLPDEKSRLARIAKVVNRTNPGPGGFYDDLGDPRNSPHLVRDKEWHEDPGYYETPLHAFGRGTPPVDSPRAWWDYCQVHYDTPLKVHYRMVDPKAPYRIRVVYSATEFKKVKLDANGLEVHGLIAKPHEELEFDVPPAATAKGSLTLSWSQDPGAGGTGRGCQVCEVWLIRAKK
jgi:hypothetical protein